MEHTRLRNLVQNAKDIKDKTNTKAKKSPAKKEAPKTTTSQKRCAVMCVRICGIMSRILPTPNESKLQIWLRKLLWNISKIILRRS